MKKTTLTIFIALLLVFMLFSSGSAASIILDVPKMSASNSEPFDVVVSLDAEDSALGAIEGKFTYDATLFKVESITTRSSVVSLWLSQPKRSNIITSGTTSTLVFEGVMPGGYKGVRSPYYDGVRPGLLFIVTLIPINRAGSTMTPISISEARAYLFNDKGTPLTISTQTRNIEVPTQSIEYSRVQNELSYRDSNTLQVVTSRDPYIGDNKWYISIIEDQSVRPVSKIEVAETGEYDITRVKNSEWKEVNTMLYILDNQSRTTYTHIKIFYENNTYTTWTILPVDNLPIKTSSSRILIGISIIILLSFIYVFCSSHILTRTKTFLTKKFFS